CDEALRLRPRFWNAYNNRALAWLALGHLVNARADLEAGLALNPNSRNLEKVRVMLLAREAEMNVTMAAVTPANR
ncbi:MAG: tetratricopeptide repeat protein, partial [Gammaproteobacteria bacterium]|nr:tetratricopeptide repeat protein [Gammaproteobacteria bacterium]